jgi:hypothetical protein
MGEEMRKPDPRKKFGIEELLISVALIHAAAWFSFGLITFVTWAFDTDRLQELPGTQTHVTTAVSERAQPPKSR